MIDKTALITATIATTLFGLICQLIFILGAAAIGNIDDSYTFFDTYKHEIWFGLALFTHCVTVLAGGALTAFFVYERMALHAGLVGGLSTAISLAMSVGEDQFTSMSIFMLLSGIGLAILGGHAWNRWVPTDTPEPETH
jgi:hypothetical protein